MVLALSVALLSTPALGERVPMAKQGTAKPRLSLRLFKSKLAVQGTADVRRIRPVRALGAQTVTRIERKAAQHLAAAEAMVREAYTTELPKRERAALLDRAQRTYSKWETQVRALIRGRALTSPVYQEWAQKTWEARLVKLHAAVRASDPKTAPADALQGHGTKAQVTALLTRLHRMPADKLRQEVNKAWEGLYGGARPAAEGDLLQSNPLALLPRAWRPRASKKAPAETMAYTPPRNPLSPRTWRPKTYQVRKDVVFVWVPGVARTYTEFEKQKTVLMENGVLALQANTGSWRNPFRNAYDIAKSVNEARRITGNPSVKVVLVGYSQGNTSSYAFMQAEGRNAKEKAMFAELQKNVIQIYDLNSAARGTPVADLGVTMTKILTGRGGELPDLQGTLKQAEQFFQMRNSKVKRAVAAWIGRNQQRIGKVIRAVCGRNAKTLPSRFRACVADTIHDLALGSLESLTTWRGQELMGSAKLKQAIKHVPILNTVGVVPASRPELVPTLDPLDQRPGWRFMLERGLANDYQVPAKYQRLKPALEQAVDLPTQAIGHWGITGVKVSAGKVVHDEKQYQQFSPELHTYTMLQQLQRMGL